MADIVLTVEHRNANIIFFLSDGTLYFIEYTHINKDSHIIDGYE